jgi:iron(III) transport system substrate-binding protein
MVTYREKERHMKTRRTGWTWLAGPTLVGALLAWTTAGWAAGEDLAKLVEAAKQEGEVHYIDALIQPKTHALLERAFRKKYGLPDSFKVTHTLRGTGEVVATVQQEIKAGQHTIDFVWVGAPAFFKAAAKDGHFLPYASPEWKRYEAAAKRVGLEVDPPNWITPAAYTFVPVWNRKCPGFASVQIKTWKDMLNPAFRDKSIIGDVRKSFTYAATWAGMEGALGKDFLPKYVEVTQPVIVFRTEESLQKVMSCEYPIQLWQISGRVYQRALDDPTLDLGVAWPEEGVVVLSVPMAILKGSKRPNAAKLFMEFLLSEEGMQAFVTGEGVFSLREGFQVPAAVKKYTPDIATVKPMLVNWGTFTIPEVRKVQDQFRKILRVE